MDSRADVQIRCDGEQLRTVTSQHFLSLAGMASESIEDFHIVFPAERCKSARSLAHADSVRTKNGLRN